MVVYGDVRSGNCLKVKWACDRLALPYRWVDTPSGTGATAEPQFMALNPAGQIPVVQWPDGRCLAQSNAIVLHLAEGSTLMPRDRWDRAKALEWMFWEQYSHEPVIAVRRARIVFGGLAEGELDPTLLPRGAAALELMEQWLGTRPWFSGPGFGVADVALLPYTRLAPEGGFDLDAVPSVRRWIAACERELGLSRSA
jgi:glutathione S-transferase